MKGKKPRRPTSRAGAKTSTRPALGNDPFERGAAERPGVSGLAAHAPSAAGPEREHGGSAPSAAAPRSPKGRTEVASTPVPPPPDLAAELAEALGTLLPALRERLASAVSLLHLVEGVGVLDEFGMDPTLPARATSLLDFLYLSWWRVDARGIDVVPATGPAVLVANHGGTVPWDALVLRLALRREHSARRDLRPLLDPADLQRPVLGRIASRLGAVAATPENALKLLGAGEVVAVFPEGSGPRPWPQRYHIGAFGRGGFVKLARRTGAAVIPCAVVGSEEASPPLSRVGFLGEALRLPLLGNAPGLPLGPLVGIPLPARFGLRFGEPIDLSGPDDADRLAAETRARIQALLDAALVQRRSIYL